MIQTPFLARQKEISDKVNHENRHLIYPHIDPLIKSIRYDYDEIGDDIKKYLDKELGIDYSFWAKFPDFPDFMRFFVQYRYRDDEWQKCQDLTITMHNDAPDIPGELSKLLAQLFVYGYHTKLTHRLVEVLVADCQKMRNGILTGMLPYTIGHNPRSHQPFVKVKFDKLYEQNMVLLHWRETDSKRKLLHRGSLAGLLPAAKVPRQVNPDTSPVEGIIRAEHGYSIKGQPRDAILRKQLEDITRFRRLQGREEDDD